MAPILHSESPTGPAARGSARSDSGEEPVGTSDRSPVRAGQPAIGADRHRPHRRRADETDSRPARPSLSEVAVTAPITVGYDGSPESTAAAQWAVREAELRGLRLELLLAWPWMAEEMLGQPDAVAESRSRLGRQEAELRAQLSTVDVTAVQWTGSAGQALVEAGEHAAMLALGSRGLSTLRGFLVGPVGRHVLERAACPIVLVRPTRDTPRSTGEVVLGLDLDHHCGGVIAFAFESAALRSVPLRVVHAWRPPGGGDLAPAVVAELEEEMAADAMERFTAAVEPWREKYPDVTVVASLLRGSPAATLIDAVGRPDLLVVGRRSGAGSGGPHLGPVTEAAVHHVHSPLAVVPYG
ncbi:universal stress protein [Kitasatospora paracochleata]